MHFIALLLTLFFGFQVYFLCVLTQIFRKTQKYQTKKFLEEHPVMFFFGPFYDHIYRQRYFNGLFIICVYAKNIARFIFGISCLLFIITTKHFKYEALDMVVSIVIFICVYTLISDLLPRLLSLKQAKNHFLVGSFFSSIYLTILFPFLHPYLKITQFVYTKESSSKEHQQLIKEKMYELLRESLPDKNLEANDKMLIESILKFKGRIVREIMIPRMDVFALPDSLSIKEAATLFLRENYSRVPVYTETLDEISGIVLYKDLFRFYLEAFEKNELNKLQEPIKTLATKAFYTPETRKISHLLQEFLQKQQHLALVVDEFGAIEGIISIEDLLEEIVGDIADEYDEEEENLFTPQQNAWIVSGRMSLFDIEQECNVKIPRLGDYDTIGGYIIHRSGMIPEPGLKIDHDDFEVEVLNSTDRQIKKVKITPRVKLTNE